MIDVAPVMPQFANSPVAFSQRVAFAHAFSAHSDARLDAWYDCSTNHMANGLKYASGARKILRVSVYLVRPACSADHTMQINRELASDVDHLTFRPLALTVLV